MERRGATVSEQRAGGWQSQAACRTADVEIMFPTRAEDVPAALAFCAVCDVRAECLRWALDNDETSGVWGGMNAEDRRIKANRQPVFRHGTDAGYRRHLRQGEYACAECRAAHVEAGRRHAEPRARIAQCGTDAGYYRHIRITMSVPCRACKDAHAEAERVRDAARPNRLRLVRS
jgi:WhiB family redox-sensing transcriptional regulator